MSRISRKAIEVARKHYPEPPRKAAKPEPCVPELKPVDLKTMPKAESPAEPPVAAQEFEWRIWKAGPQNSSVRGASAFNADRAGCAV